MKKKKTITLIAACMALFAGTQTSWAQNGVLLPENQVDTRRGDADALASEGYIGTKNHDGTWQFGGATNVSNEFGAGETSTITSGNVSWPAFNGLHNPPESIQLGSDYSQNIVINTYNAGGYATGILYLKVISGPEGNGFGFDARNRPLAEHSLKEDAGYDYNTNPIGDPNHGDWPVGTFSGGTFNDEVYENHTNLSVNGVITAVSVTSVKDYDSYNTRFVHLYLSNHGSEYVNHWEVKAISNKLPYTSLAGYNLSAAEAALKDTIDDGVKLIQVSGEPAANPTVTILSAPGHGEDITNYKRPTTVAIEGENNFYAITFKDLNWWYRWHELGTVTNCNGTKENQDRFCVGVADNFSDLQHGCGHISVDPEVSLTSIGNWVYKDALNKPNNVKGQTYLDEAVQILGDADVCVTNSIVDKTVTNPGKLGTAHTTGSNALLVFPDAGKRFTLHVGDSIAPMAMIHDGNTTNENLKYTEAEFTAKTAATDIYLYKGNQNVAWSFGKELLSYSGVATIQAPKDEFGSTTDAGILGVYNTYSSDNAKIHTSNGGTGENNKGIIEVGSATGNHAGQSKFNIYSGGIFKNYLNRCSTFCDSIYVTSTSSPTFTIDGTEPLFILNDGKCCDASIVLDDPSKVADAVTNAPVAGGVGALHIQAYGNVKFNDAFAPTVANNNEIRILSDAHAIEFNDELNYTNSTDSKDANLFIWANGSDFIGPRSCMNDCGGYVYMKGATNIIHNGIGRTVIRSQNDDVILDENDFVYKNENTNPAMNGEFIMQAGQDIYAKGNMTYTQSGNKNVLLEAKNTIHTKQTVTFNKDKAASANSGDFILKAGYKNFSDNSTPTTWTIGDCRSLINDDVIKIYKNREECTDTEGGDIWFEGPVVVNIKAKADDNTTSTLFRAYNSVFIDDALTYTQETKEGGNARIFAHKGNIEAIKNDGKIVLYDIKNADNTGEIRLQAGNVPAGTTDDPNICESNNPCSLNEWNGNILFNKTFNITNKGKGYTEISAERDIETQIKGVANFTYDNASAGDFKMTAGRHIETHAPMIYKYTNAPSSNITMEAGRGDCTYNACEAIEEVGSNLTKDGDATLAYDPSGTYVNTFSEGGFGNGSILMFAPVKFDYDGSGLIYMKAVNGNIESDPYLHPANGGYGTGSLLSFDHKGKGVTKMQAIDIRLHDKINYNANSMDIENGQFYMLAYDSIITRDLTYTNAQDTGSIYIITDKYKSRCNKIQQGHIVLGYGADCTAPASNDNITFDFAGNTNITGANVHILAGFAGFNNHTSKRDSFGGNITFDYIKAKMAVGNHAKSGYMEMKTPNGNIWGKDSITFFGQEGDLLVDAGMGSKEDPDAEAWVNGENGATTTTYGMNTNILNTSIPIVCSSGNEWRTGNIMMKGGSLNFSGNATGNATFRTRLGYIDTYDAFNVYGMKGQLLKYAHDDNDVKQWGDVSERDFSYAPADGSVYFGADDNIMMNYGNSNGYQKYTNDGPCQFQGSYDCSNILDKTKNPYYNTTYGTVTNYAKFNVNTNGYQWYNQWPDYEGYPYIWKNGLHKLYRGGSESCNKSGIAGTCATPSNGARDLTLPFTGHEGGFAAVANNYIDFFTKVIYNGGSGSGMATPTVGTIVGENVQGYGLYIKSRNLGDYPEKRRITCEECGTEWPAVTFHDDARIHAENQKVNLEGPVIEFFGHAELDAQLNKGSKTNLVVKGDSLIFHDSAIFDGADIKLLPFTTEGRGMRHGIVNDVNIDFYKGAYRQAITMTDRMLPVLELGYQRCNEPLSSPNKAPNTRSDLGKEEVPTVGGDVIVAVKDGYKLPIFNTVVANHARISFVSDSLDHKGNVYLNAFVRTDLLRIRNKVEFYTGEGTGKNEPKNRVGHFEMTSTDQMVKPTFDDAGMYPKHLHMEPGSELSIPGENTLTAIATTTIGGYGEIHEDVYIKANGTIAPGHSSLMEQDCTSGKNPGMLKIHNLVMDKDAEFRISLGDQTGNNSTGVDTLYVEDTVRFNGKIPLYVLTDVKSVETGCYTFLIYNDKDGVSKEYVKNLVLKIDRYEDNYFSLNYSTPGEVKLCVSKSPNPVVQQYVELPVVEGVTLTPYTGGKHYVVSQQSFTFYATYTGAPLKVMADGVYDGKHVEIFGEKQSDGSYKYILTYVVEPWTVTIGPEFATNFVGNEAIEGNKVWAYKNMLYVNVSESDIASIYTMTGVLYKRVELPEGNSKFTLDKGMYIVTLKDGSVHKIVIK